jgi:EAL domain-containing protein (putative c-di-GMP-specific phosphodiesterase class I)
MHLSLPSESVSKEHAEICQEGDRLLLRDLASTNGTFVNSERVDSTSIREGDILHFADFEFRVGRQDSREVGLNGNAENFSKTVQLKRIELSQEFALGTREFGELLRARAVYPVFQPIVSLETGELTAYEVLGRGCYPGLPGSPSELFRIAESVGAEADLSRLFVETALESVADRSDLPTLFVNTHPAELADPKTPETIARQIQIAPQVHVVLEIHEAVLDEDLPHIRRLRTKLSELGVGLAYDDFGSGQAHLFQLGEVVPDYLKFDIKLVSDIDKASPSRKTLLRSLVDVARNLEILTIAEGIETEAQANLCTELGFNYAQGYLFGRPSRLKKI